MKCQLFKCGFIAILCLTVCGALTHAQDWSRGANIQNVSDANSVNQSSNPLANDQTAKQYWNQAADPNSPPAYFVQDETTEQKDDKYEELLKQIEANKKSIDGLKDDSADFAKGGHGDQSMEIVGRVHFDYWTFPDVEQSVYPLEGGDPQDRFLFRRIRIGAKGKVKDNMVYRATLEFAGGNDTEYRDVYLGWTDLPVLQQLLIGNQKRFIGLDHINSSRYNVFIERPYVVESFNEDARRLGIASYGTTEDLCYHWQYGIFNQEKTQDDPGYFGDHYQPQAVGRLAAVPWWDETSGGRGYLHMAMSGTFAVPDGTDPTNNLARFRTRPEARTSNRWLDTGRIADADKYYQTGLECVLNIGALHIGGEYLTTDVDRDNGQNDVQFDGGYVYVAYFLTGEHVAWDRGKGQLGRVKPFENFFAVRDCDGCVKRGMGAWQVAYRYSDIDLNDDNITGGTAASHTIGMNWWWNPYARMQFNYIFGNIQSPTAGAGGGGGDYEVAGVRFMIDF